MTRRRPSYGDGPQWQDGMNRPTRYLMLACGLISLYIAVTNIAEGALSDVLAPSSSPRSS